jgi:hypothetical protein
MTLVLREDVSVEAPYTAGHFARRMQALTRLRTVIDWRFRKKQLD